MVIRAVLTADAVVTGEVNCYNLITRLRLLPWFAETINYQIYVMCGVFLFRRLLLKKVEAMGIYIYVYIYILFIYIIYVQVYIYIYTVYIYIYNIIYMQCKIIPPLHVLKLTRMH